VAALAATQLGPWVCDTEVDEKEPNRSRDRKGALLALPIDLTLPYGRAPIEYSLR
jgi:hypothetical protein